MRADILLAAKKAQYWRIRSQLMMQFVGFRWKLGEWNDHAYYCSGFNVGNVHFYLAATVSQQTIYRQMRDYRMPERGRSVVYRFERDLCDQMAKVAIQQLLSIGLSTAEYIQNSDELQLKYHSLPIFTGEEAPL
ncbi:hypothetical protein [Methylophilus sp. 3sh_L]|uniref:hypothetical protein n=1 Tax=Methylophilus sp. 3sh_L TaxID=3377114 RepID=UPI00398E3888